MKKMIQGLCALLTCGLVVASLPSGATQVEELTIEDSTSTVEGRTIVVEEYFYQPMREAYVFQQYLQLETAINRISMGGALQFTALADDTKIYLDILTDLNGDGYYEWMDSQCGAVRQLVSADGTFVAGDSERQQLAMGEHRTLSAATLLDAGMRAEQSRMADGETPLYSLVLSDSGTLLYCLTVESDGGAESYYIELDYILDPVDDVRLLGAGIFGDVPSWAWYWDEVDWAVRQGVMNGVTATQFRPDSDTTRGALMQVLYAQAGAPDVTPAEFVDVSQDDWYADAVAWGSGLGLVNGYSNGTFQPEKSVTREQLATIFYNMAEKDGLSLTQQDTLYGFSDGATTSSWAKTAMSWAVAVDLLEEEDGGLMNPQGAVSRAKLASILMKYDARKSLKN